MTGHPKNFIKICPVIRRGKKIDNVNFFGTKEKILDLLWICFNFQCAGFKINPRLPSLKNNRGFVIQIETCINLSHSAYYTYI